MNLQFDAKPASEVNTISAELNFPCDFAWKRLKEAESHTQGLMYAGGIHNAEAYLTP